MVNKTDITAEFSSELLSRSLRKTGNVSSHGGTNNTSDNENEHTGLPFPRSWAGAYNFVIASFALWIFLLVALTESGK